PRPAGGGDGHAGRSPGARGDLGGLIGMAKPKPIAVYLEVTRKRTFAGAIEWPGWCRSGTTPEDALEALFAYRDRYARALTHSRLGFAAPASLDQFDVVERLKGHATTEFGAP